MLGRNERYVLTCFLNSQVIERLTSWEINECMISLEKTGHLETRPGFYQITQKGVDYLTRPLSRVVIRVVENGQ